MIGRWKYRPSKWFWWRLGDQW